MEPQQQALTTGSVLAGRYQIINLIGQGGMSRVYLADDLRLNVRVAVKENLQAEPQAREQFHREAQILARLSHPSLPRVSDHFDDAVTGRQYLVMDYIEGEDLNLMVKRLGPLPEATAVAWISQILDALDYLHSQQPPVIHRDIKPSNIKISPSGKAVLVDFGIAKIYEDSGMTAAGARSATPGYAPPEQYGLRTNQRSDIYALGATLYTLLTGQVPPESTLRVSNLAVLVPPRQIAPALAPQTETAILGAMELDTTRRWTTAAAFRAALHTPASQSNPFPPGMATARVTTPLPPSSTSTPMTPTPTFQPAYSVPPPPTQAVPPAKRKSRIWLWAIIAIIIIGIAATLVLYQAGLLLPQTTIVVVPAETATVSAAQDSTPTITEGVVALEPTASPTQTPASTDTPTSSLAPASPTATSRPATATPTTPFNTNTPASTAPAPSPTRAGPPVIAVAKIRVDPADTRRKQQITFYVTFRNTFTVPQQRTLAVWVYDEDQPRQAFWRMEPAAAVTLPVGDFEWASTPTMCVCGPGGPKTFTAYIRYVAPDGGTLPVPSLNGSDAALRFAVNP